jgi:hypothetical protein
VLRGEEESVAWSGPEARVDDEAAAVVALLRHQSDRQHWPEIAARIAELGSAVGLWERLGSSREPLSRSASPPWSRHMSTSSSGVRKA